MKHTEVPGRSCPLHYRYSPSGLNRPPEIYADVLYVAGGLYGNVPALDRILAMCAAERGATQLVFNGDFNWFNVDAPGFARINEAVLQHYALRGNVETELAADEETFGCGCGYPDWVADDVVEKSNQIMHALRITARELDALRRRLAALPMHLIAQVGRAKIAIVHGDGESLAGWSFAQEALSATTDNARLKEWFRAAGAQLFASTHTCLPIVKSVPLPDGSGVIANNGAAGMSNLKGTTFGLITRVGTRPAPHPSVFGMRLRDTHVDLLKVEYDQRRWLELFERNWPPGSPAHLSYFDRIVNGPDFSGPISV
jgi:hypothetical protein